MSSRESDQADGRPFSADMAIQIAIKIDDHFDRLEFLKAWEAGDWTLVKVWSGEFETDGRPKPIEYTTREGGPWFSWSGMNPKRTAIHAIRFDDGFIFDAVNGWRLFASK